MINLILVRHGENDKDDPNGGLTSNGTTFANYISTYFRDEEIAISEIWVGQQTLVEQPPERCKATVRPLSTRTGLPIQQGRLVDLLRVWGTTGGKTSKYVLFVFRSVDFELIEEQIRVRRPEQNLTGADLDYHTIVILTNGTGPSPITFDFATRVSTGIRGRAKS